MYFYRVSLKQQLSLPDLERLIDEVRRRVEFEDVSAKQRVRLVFRPMPYFV